MCRHIINAQVSIFWGDKWFDCHECYAEHEGRCPDLSKLSRRVALACKSCRQLFHKDFGVFGKVDETCPHCGVRFVIPAMTPKSCLLAEARMSGAALLREYLAKPLEVRVDVDRAAFSHLVAAEARRGPSVS